LRLLHCADATAPCATAVRSRDLTAVHLHLVSNAVDDRLVVGISIMKRLRSPLMVSAYPNVPARFHHRRRCQRSCISTIPDVVVISGNCAISIFFSLSRFHSADTLPCLPDPTTSRETTAGIARTALQPTPSATKSGDPVVPRMRSTLGRAGPLGSEADRHCP